MTINIYTDGAHSSSTDVGGWSFILSIGGLIYSYSGYEFNTTNNRMELLAVLNALKKLQSIYNPTTIYYDTTELAEAIIYTDSAYIANCFSQRWYINWANNGWKTSKKTPVLNKDLWEEILNLYHYLNISNKVEIKKVSGHSGHELNEMADFYAVQARIEGAKVKENEEKLKAAENTNIDTNSSC